MLVSNMGSFATCLADKYVCAFNLNLLILAYSQ